MDKKVIITGLVLVLAVFLISFQVTQQGRADAFVNGYICAYEHENEELNENYFRAYDYSPTEFCTQFHTKFDELNFQNYSKLGE